MPVKRPASIPFLPSIRRLLQLAGRNKTWLFVALVVDLIDAGLLILSNHFLRHLFDAVQTTDRQAD